MKMILQRIAKKADYTIGHLYIDGVYFCDTLENRDRGLSKDMDELQIRKLKVAARTAIPTGEYRVDMDTVSPKYKQRKASWAKPYGYKLPRLMGVKGFAGILIHVGNTERDTDGCLLVGLNKKKGELWGSKLKFHELMDTHLVPAQQRGERITIEVR